MKQYFFLGTTYLGSRDVPDYIKTYDGRLKPLNSYLYVCSRCQDVWARITVGSSDSYAQPLSRNCRQHAIFPADGFLSERGDGPYPLPGLEIDDTWPLQAIHHDFQTALARAEISST